ncbi:PREDICTED: atrial natriuretic peptide receptor 1-like, partial [Priapulus caudatus]|uniref:guanylate cyclase n=1 Tax=Priapulus caudatus TaxID=37621 RepID=A0ABM1EUY7_PRICU
MLEMKLMRELNHENLVRFYGACIEPPNICTITQYCAKGALTDVLADDDMRLDDMFIMSFISDIIAGCLYLHRSELKTHGNLKSSNCLVDSRWVIKLTDFGLQQFLKSDNNERQSKDLMWTAPELLRHPEARVYGTQAGDVYSFSIVIQQIFTRSPPYDTNRMLPEDIIDRVQRGVKPYFRPSISKERCPNTHIWRLMALCWDEMPDLRPDFTHIAKVFKVANGGRTMRIMDNMVSMLETHANHLEELVANRTKQLYEEKKKTDELLYRMLPAVVAERLKQGKYVQAETYDEVTIYFSDIVEFTSLCADSTPLQVVDFLNDLYTLFDGTIPNYDVYKVETIGDAYMVASGLPMRNGNRHAAEIANMALDLLTKVKTFEIRHLPGARLLLRIGIHTGPCVAGIAGLTMPRYCLFGDTVNTASRMESTGL